MTMTPLPQDPPTGWDYPIDMLGQRGDRLDTRRPVTTLEALMQAKPGDDPARSLDDAADLREAVQDALDKLSPHDQRIIEAYDFEGITYVQLGERMGVQKTQAERLHKRALQRLRFAMLNEEVITSHIGVDRTFESEVHRLLLDLAPSGDEFLADEWLGIYMDDLAAQHLPYQSLVGAGRCASVLLEAEFAWNFDAIERWVLKLAPRVLTARKFGVGGIYALALVEHQEMLASVTERTRQRALKKIVLLAVLAGMYEADTIDNGMENGNG